MSDLAADAVVVVGERRWTVDPTVRRSADSAIEADVVCATGNRYSAEWAGVPVSTLAERARAPAETTHLVVESHDGYRMTVPIAAGIDGLLAVEKDGRPIGETEPYDTRFVAPDVAGARDVKGVARIEFRALDAGEDPEAFEQFEPDDDRFAAPDQKQ
ncbi:MAG: molybdopterin-dependent oxidoreductase [Halanaeroarchaeum sp.]